MKSAVRTRLLASTLLVGSAAIAHPALAQTTSQEAAVTQTQADGSPMTEETSTGDIVVTGTLIANPNLTASAPVSVVGQDEVQLRQVSNAEQILRDVPGAVPNLGQNVNNGQVGSARVDLRGLGANRNIVLLDGNRLVPSSFFGAVDLNNIPLALVERVDVLTGGASTTYGADAVSGVVNFITRSDFAGMDAQVATGITERGDGHNVRADLLIGANFDDGRGNAVLGLSYQEADPIYQGARDISIFGIASNTGVASGSSPTSVPTVFSLANGQFLQVNPTSTGLVPYYNGFNFNPFNIFVTPFKRYNMYAAGHYDVSDTVTVYGRGMFSKNTVQQIIAASGIFGNTPSINANNPYLNASTRDTLCTAAGIPLGSVNQGTTIACNNRTGTVLPAAGIPVLQQNVIPLGAVYRRSVELGPRVSTFVTQFFDYQAGMKLNLADNLTLDVKGAYGESENVSTQSGYFANSRVQQALFATSTTACANTANGCVPLNIFGESGSITPAQNAFVGGITSSVSNTASLAQASALLSGDLGFTSPAASEPIGFAVGGEYRDYGARRIPDNLAQVPGELGGAGGAILPLTGGYNVKEVFGEVIAPLVADKPFFNELTIEAGVRYSKYKVETAGSPKFNATTWKVGGSWEPVEALKFRGNYQRAVRAPNIGELFAPVTTGLTSLQIDPCASIDTQGARRSTGPTGFLRDVCLAQGAPLANINGIIDPAAGQANGTGGGNPLIRPETAKTYTAGVVIQPRDFVDGLTITIDYYNIKVNQAITAQTPGDAINACFGNLTAASATSAACLAIRRNAVNGRLSGTNTATNPILGLPTPLTNNGRLATDGVDLNVNYKRDLGFAALNLNFAGNWTNKSVFQAASTSYARDCVGYFSANCGSPANGGSLQPKYYWNQRTTLTFEDIDVSLLWRHIDKMRYEGTAADFAARGFTAASRFLYNSATAPAAQSTITGPTPLAGRRQDFNKIGAYDYFDLAVRFRIVENFELGMTVTNLLDKDPPLVGAAAGTTSFNSGNTFPSTYDAVGRRYSASARVKF